MDRYSVGYIKAFVVASAFLALICWSSGAFADVVDKIAQNEGFRSRIYTDS